MLQLFRGSTFLITCCPVFFPSMALGVFHNKTRDQLNLGCTGHPTLLKPNIPDSVLSLSIKVFTMLWIPSKVKSTHPKNDFTLVQMLAVV